MRRHFFTKAFPNAVNSKHACVFFIQVVNPTALSALGRSLDLRREYLENSSPDSRGVPTNDENDSDLALSTLHSYVHGNLDIAGHFVNSLKSIFQIHEC